MFTSVDKGEIIHMHKGEEKQNLLKGINLEGGIIGVLRESSWPFGSKLPGSEEFGINVAYKILFQFLTGDPRNSSKLWSSVWPPRAAPGNASQEQKGYKFSQYLIFKVLGSEIMIIDIFCWLKGTVWVPESSHCNV